MIIITISKRKLKLFAAAFLAVILTFVGITQIFGNQGIDNYKVLVEALRQTEVAVSDEVLTATSPTPDTSNDEIQIFDVGKGNVVKKMKSTPTLQAEAEKVINSITGLYVKVQPLPEKGYIVRIPMSPPMTVQSRYINAIVDKIYVIFTKNNPPIVLILDSRNKPFVYNFSSSTEALKKNLGFDFIY